MNPESIRSVRACFTGGPNLAGATHPRVNPIITVRDIKVSAREPLFFDSTNLNFQKCTSLTEDNSHYFVEAPAR